jgi:hypothetical protein
MGCYLAQGYGIARPMPANELPAWAAVWKPFSSWVNLLPVSRDDLPILFAAVEHRAWVVAIEAFLNAKTAVLPQMDPHLCRFGEWLANFERQNRGAQPALQNIVSLHLQVHELGDRLQQLFNQRRQTEVHAGLVELHRLRDAMFSSLWQFMRSAKH